MAKGKYEYWLTEDGRLLLSSWARDGLLHKDIAKRCGVSVKTLYEWCNKYSEIGEAIKKDKEVVDYEVENSLYRRCVGYYVEEEVAFKCKTVSYDANKMRHEKEEIQTATVKRYIPPETMAQLAWLNNRKGDKWRRNAGKEKLDESKFEHEKQLADKKYW